MYHQHAQQSLDRPLSWTPPRWSAEAASPDTSWSNLTKTAEDQLLALMSAMGNRISGDHRQALREVLAGFTAIASEQSPAKRTCFALPCGSGKTLAIRAWCFALHASGIDIGVTIAVETIAQMETLIDALIADGIPEESIGLVHTASATHMRHPSLHSEVNDGRRFLIVTHARLANPDALGQLTYRSRPRAVTIVDESLITMGATFVAIDKLLPAIARLGELARLHPEDGRLHEASAFLSACHAVIDAERERLAGNPKATPKVLELPRITTMKAEQLRIALSDHDPEAEILTFLSMVGRPLRMVIAGEVKIIVAIKALVPPELTRVAILDASAPIRTLIQADPDLVIHQPSALSDIKRYDQVTLHWWKRASGRASTEREFARGTNDRHLSNEIIALIRDLDPEQPILFFTFRNRGSPVSTEDILRSDLAAAGIDPEAITSEGKPRFNWLTYGQHKANSAFTHCQHVIFVGMLHRSKQELAASLVAQSRWLLKPITAEEIAACVASEIADVIYQAANRGSCRTTIDGQAAPMDIWLAHASSIPIEIVQEIMPGMRVVEWGQGSGSKSKTRIEQASDAIACFLRALPPETTEVSTRHIKRSLGLDTLGNVSFQRARDRACAKTGWIVRGRSLVRST